MRRWSAILCIAFSTNLAHADIKRSPDAWTVAPPFEKSADARQALSGAACARGTNHCLVVNDEKKYAQFFEITGSSLIPGEVIRLLPDEVDGVDMDEIDAEGVAYVAASEEGGGTSYYYVIGSHGLSRQGALQPSRFFLFRFPIDPSTGLPTFQFGDSDPGPEIERTALLRDTAKSLAKVVSSAEQPLDRNGVTIEGIAAHRAGLLLGLRSPCVASKALVLRVPFAELFNDAVMPAAQATELELGDNVGVRDLAAVGDGVLILAGRSDDERGDGAFTCGESRAPPIPAPSVWFWNGDYREAPEALGTLPGLGPGESAETMIVLEESDTTYRTLVMFDGVENGGPIEFTIDK